MSKKQPDLKIVMVKSDTLISSEYNPRKISQLDYEQLKSSILRFGMIDPLIVNCHPKRKNIIIGGHQRFYVLQDIGFNPVPVVYVSLTAAKEKELNVRLNRNTGEWDWEILSSQFEMEELAVWGFSEGELLANIDVEMDTDIDFKMGDRPDPNDNPDAFVSFSFGDIRGNIARPVYQSFLKKYNTMKKEPGNEMLEDVLKKIFDV